MKKILLYIVLLMAVGMAGIVAYVSVSGLLKVFTGAGTLGLMLFSAIEIAKIVATSAIHTYGKKIGWFYNILLSLMIVISMAITSMGIYGFLSSTYRESFAKLEAMEIQIEMLEKKRDGYQEQLNYVIVEKTSVNEAISELSQGLSNNVIEYKDPETGKIIRTTSSSTRRALEKQLDKAIERQEKLTVKADTLTNQVFNVDNDILETKLNNDTASELGPLKYLAEVTGKTMDEVMKWFILLLIIIGDPMAVLMVIVFNKVVKKGDDNGHQPNVDDKGDDTPSKPLDFDKDIYIPKLDEDEKVVDVEVKNLKDDEVVDYVKLIQDKLKRGIPIENDAVNDAVNEAANEVVELEVEPSLPNPSEMIVKEKKEKVRMDEEVVEEENHKQYNLFEKKDGFSGKPLFEEEIRPEEQIEENIKEVKQLKREPIIPRGEILKEDVVKDRGFSVDVPEPNITKVGTNKEVRDNENNVLYFKRKRGDELGD